MATKDLTFGMDSQARLISGVNKLANAVKVTLGPRGRNVIIERGFGEPTVTKDGVSVAKEIDLKDPIENMGAQMVKSAAAKTADEAGDGTSTATVLTQAIAAEGFKMLQAGCQAVEIKRGMDKMRELLVEEVRRMAVPVESIEDMTAVATISANNERDLGEIIAQAIDAVGKNGVVTIEESSNGETYYDTVDGFEFPRGWKDTSRHYTAQVKDGSDTIELTNPYLLFWSKDFNSVDPKVFGGIMTEALKAGRPLVFVASNFSNTATSFLVANLIKGNEFYGIMPAGFANDDKIMHIEDMAIYSGGLVFGPGATPMESATLANLGTVDKLVIERARTLMIKNTVQGDSGQGAVQARINSIGNKILATASEFEKEKLQERIGRLSGGIAVVRVGGNSEVEVKEKKDRVEDALHATRAAAESGIVPGGGVTLLRAKASVLALGEETWGMLTKDQMVGAKLLLDALESPLRSIVANAGGKPDLVLHKILSGEALGYNAHTDTFEDLMLAGVVDPAKVTTSALTNAVSIAGMLLTTSCSITIDRGAVDVDSVNAQAGV